VGVTKLKAFRQPVVASSMQYQSTGDFPMLNPPEHSHEDLAMRARAEFREMPGMCLTTAQAARLWQVTPARAEELLTDLVQTGFLVRRDGQRYRLPTTTSS
jgi:hypothetical protein